MKRPSPKEVKAMALMVRNYPEVMDWVGDWLLSELDQLPHVGTNVAIAQGRCQVLKELHGFMKQAPDLAA